jgi:hypothetical protein
MQDSERWWWENAEISAVTVGSLKRTIHYWCTTNSDSSSQHFLKTHLYKSVSLTYIYIYIYFLWHNSPVQVYVTSLLRFLDHTQSDIHTSNKTPLISSLHMPLPMQHKTNTRDKHHWPHWDKHPQSQQSSGCRPMA